MNFVLTCMTLLASPQNGVFPLTSSPSVQTFRHAYLFRDRGVRFIYDSTWKVVLGPQSEINNLKFDIAAHSSSEAWSRLPSFSDLERAQRSRDQRAYVITSTAIIGIEYPINQQHLTPEKLWEKFKIERKINLMSLMEDREMFYYDLFLNQVFHRHFLP